MQKVISLFLIILFLGINFQFSRAEADSTKKPIPIVEYEFKAKDLILPSAVLAVGVAFSLTDEKDIFSLDRSDKYYKSTPFDDCMVLAITPTMFLFDLTEDNKHHPVDQLFLAGASYAFAMIPAVITKNLYSSDRPSGEDNDSFPSGHTTAAFVGAHVMYKEFKDSNTWIAFSGYVMATMVGIARIIHNKHWVSDVLAGAGLGILATELAYAVYFPVRNHCVGKYNKKLEITPSLSSQSVGLNLSFSF